MHDLGDIGESAVRADSYFVARTQALCGRCGAATTVLALALPRDHEMWYDADPDDPSDHGLWQVADGAAFLFHLERMSPEVARRVKQLAPLFLRERCGYGRTGNWVNHCVRCDSVLGDNDLHCELDAAFVPSSASAAALITLTRIREPLLATAAGYTFQPEFFAAMRRG